MHEAIISVVPRVHKQPFPGSVGHDIRHTFGGSLTVLFPILGRSVARGSCLRKTDDSRVQ